MSRQPETPVEVTERYQAGRARLWATALVVATGILAGGALYSTSFDKHYTVVNAIIIKRKAIPWYFSSTVVSVATFLEGVQGFVKPYLGLVTVGRGLLGLLDSASEAARTVRMEDAPPVLAARERLRKGYDLEAARLRRVGRRARWWLLRLRSGPVRRRHLGIILMATVRVCLGSATGLLLLVAALFELVRVGVLGQAR